MCVKQQYEILDSAVHYVINYIGTEEMSSSSNVSLNWKNIRQNERMQYCK
jgi:hypothetical protein